MSTRRDFCVGAITSAAAGYVSSSRAQAQLLAERPAGRLLDAQQQLKRFDFWQNRDWDWYERNIPFFESPDSAIDATYYYRWEVVTRHMRYASPEVGYVFTEFINPERLSWAGRYNVISGACDLHVAELRWMRDPAPVRSHLRYFMKVEGAQPRNYGFGPAFCSAEVDAVHGDQEQSLALLAMFVENYDAVMRIETAYPHDRGFDTERGLFWTTGRDMGSEYNLASAQLSEPLRGIVGYKIRGGAGYRPDVNAVFYAEASAIAALAQKTGQSELAKRFADRAASLRSEVQRQLWHPQREFFLHRWRYDEYSDGDSAAMKSIRAGSLIWETNHDRFGGVGHLPAQKGEGKGREIFAYHLWRYGLPEDNDDSDARWGFARAWRFLMSPAYFYSPFGPTTGERGDPWFSVIYKDCRHNGDSWPYHTSRVLIGGANLLNDYKHHRFFAPSDWWKIFENYTKTQRRDGLPYVAESHHPDDTDWTVDRPIGSHYFHSCYVDHVITGVVGLRPALGNMLRLHPLAPKHWEYFALANVEYHGHTIDVVWDRDGCRYGRGKGLLLFCDGRLIAHSYRLEPLEAVLPPKLDGDGIQQVSNGQDRLVNYAVNADAYQFPKATASFTADGDSAGSTIDGLYWYDESVPGRWTTRSSANKEDWLAIEFVEERTIQAVRVALYEDHHGISAPELMRVEVLADGTWRPVSKPQMQPPVPAARRKNRIDFDPVRTKHIRVCFKPRTGEGVGVAELETLGPATSATQFHVNT